VGVTVGLASLVGSYLFSPNTAYAQEGPSAPRREDLLSRVQKYARAIETYQSNNQTEKVKTETANLERDLLKSESGLEEAIKVIHKIDTLISDKTFVKYLKNIKISLPKEKEARENYLIRFGCSLEAFINTRTNFSSGEGLIELKLGKLFLYNRLAKISPEGYSSDKKEAENELKQMYEDGDDIVKAGIKKLLNEYDLKFDFEKPKKEEPAKEETTEAPEEPAPTETKKEEAKEETPPTEETTSAPPEPEKTEVKEVTTNLEKSEPSAITEETPFVAPGPSLESQALALENKAVGIFYKSLAEKDPKKRLDLQKKVLSLYQQAENKDPSTIGYATDIQDMKNRMLDSYREWLLEEQNAGTYETALTQAKRTLGEEKAKELDRQLQFSDQSKKSGAKTIKRKASFETTGGRNVDSVVLDAKSRLSYGMLGQAVQQSREERAINNNNEEEVTNTDIGQVDININPVQVRVIGAGGRNRTVQKTQDFDDLASLTHIVNNITRYRKVMVNDFGGLMTELNLRGCLNGIIVGGFEYDLKTTNKTTKIVNEIIDINNPNGSYPEEQLIISPEETFSKAMAFIGADRFVKTGRAGFRVGKTIVRERQGIGDQRVVRDTENTWGALLGNIMLSKYFGMGGILVRDSIKDELFLPGIPGRSRENDRFSKVRGGAAIASTIPRTGITTFAKFVYTEFCNKGSTGFLLTTTGHNNVAQNLLEIMMHETELDLGILPGQTGTVKDLLNSTNLSLLSSMTQTGERWGAGLLARLDMWTNYQEQDSWMGLLAGSLDTPRGSITGRFSVHHFPDQEIFEFRAGYASPSRLIHLELIIREIMNDRFKDPVYEMGMGCNIIF
jgi:hypothetical protein